MRFPLDAYDIKARYAPGLLVSSPMLVTLWSCFQPQIEAMSRLSGGILSAVIWYAMSVIVRGLGKRVEPELWHSWGGAPSSVIVSWRDIQIGDDLKAQYHQKVRENLNLPMPTKEEEAADPKKSLELIDQAFKRIKGVIRKEDKGGLWSIANAEYGFARNLFGSRLLWLILSISMTAVSVGFVWEKTSMLILLGFIFDCLILIGCLFFGWVILPTYTKQVGFRYAEHAWESYYNITEERKHRKQ